MYPVYKDLREKLGPPVWHDSYGVPRYAPFHPDLLGVYDDWAVLFSVRCQACDMLFPCAAGLSVASEFMRDRMVFADKDDVEKVLTLLVGWGDAPWHEGGCGGCTMSSDIDSIDEVWHKTDFEWEKIEISNELANRLRS